MLLAQLFGHIIVPIQAKYRKHRMKTEGFDFKKGLVAELRKEEKGGGGGGGGDIAIQIYIKVFW